MQVSKDLNDLVKSISYLRFCEALEVLLKLVIEVVHQRHCSLLTLIYELLKCSLYGHFYLRILVKALYKDIGKLVLKLNDASNVLIVLQLLITD